MVQTTYTNDGPKEGVALIISDGQSKGILPITNYFSSGLGADSATKTINLWLDSHRR